MAFPTLGDLSRRYVADTLNAAADASSVTSWTDTSGNSSPAVQSGIIAAPILKKNILNTSRSVVRFSGSQLLVNSTAPAGWDGSFTRYVLAKPTLGGPEVVVVGGSREYPGSPGVRIEAYGDAGKLAFQYPGNAILGKSTSTTTAAFHGFTVTYDGTTKAWAVYHDGATTPFASGTATGYTGSNAGIGLGGEFTTGTTLYDGSTIDIAEAVFCTTVHDATKRASVHSYFQDQYGVTFADYGTGFSASAAASPTTILTSATSSLTCSTVGGGGTKTYAWTPVSGPSMTFGSPTAAVTTLTPTGGAGTYVAQCVVTDSVSGAAPPAQVTVTAATPSTYVVFTAVGTNTGWTPTGGTMLATVTDASGATLCTSSNNPSALKFSGTFGAITPPAGGTALGVLVDMDRLGSSSGTLQFKLLEGATVRSTVSGLAIPTGTAGADVTGQVTVVIPAVDCATVTSWAALTGELYVTAAP